MRKSTSPFVHSSSYLHQYGLKDVYFILWLILQYRHYSLCSSGSHWPLRVLWGLFLCPPSVPHLRYELHVWLRTGVLTDRSRSTQQQCLFQPLLFPLFFHRQWETWLSSRTVQLYYISKLVAEPSPTCEQTDSYRTVLACRYFCFRLHRIYSVPSF